MNRSFRLIQSRWLARRIPQTRSNNVELRLTSVSSLPVARTLSTSTGNTATRESIDEAKNRVLEASLQEVHTHGWTEEAISAGVVSSKLPLSMMGIITPNDMITHFMDTCQQDFQHELDTKLIPLWREESNPNLPKRLEIAIQTRLKYVIPHVKSNTWHEGMALGATSNTAMTASQLDAMVQSIADAILVGTDHAPLGLVQRTAIGALYISTELFLLTDSSLDYQDTWEFTRTRIAEMHLLANSANWNSIATGDTAIAFSAVATSLGGAVVSLLQPAARGAVSAAASTIVPHLATFLQPVRQETRGDGTRASDYNVAPNTGDTESKPPVTANT
jgi:ubiquinone biosynthesis protein COQ9